MTVYAYTSAAVNYVPKARVLARSIKRLHPEIYFSLLLAEPLPDGVDLSCDDFDEIVTVQELGLQNLDSWLFKHSLVELCTAIKGFQLCRLLAKDNCEGVLYFDPDMAVFSPLDDIVKRFEGANVLLTPHLLSPERELDAVLDNEVCALKYGVYNLGFLGVKNSEEGKRFAKWWRDRLEQLCYDEVSRGLFTDQRWVDLAPVFFDGVEAIRDPGCNVATWNLTNREVFGDFQSGFRVNDSKLTFYHFSGFDSGSQLAMLRKYGAKMPALNALRDWYIQECLAFDDSRVSSMKWRYSFYANGESVTDEHRKFYRSREDLQERFPNPFETPEEERSFLKWFKSNVRKPGNSASELTAERPDGDSSDGNGSAQLPQIAISRKSVLPFDSTGFFPLFHPSFYLSQYPEVAAEQIDPLHHYLTKGVNQLKNPCALFSTEFYLLNNKSIVTTGINPLKHFIQEGWKQGSNPHALFDVSHYLQQNPDVRESGQNPLSHYILEGWRQGRDPHPLFNTNYYVQQVPELVESTLNPLEHYLLFGADQGFDPHPIFDTSYYVECNSDIEGCGLNPLVHFCLHGWKERRNPNNWFLLDLYDASRSIDTPDVNSVAHFLQTAKREGCEPDREFFSRGTLFDSGRRQNEVARLHPSVGEKRPTVLFIHYNGGGVRKHVNDLVQKFSSQCRFMMLTPLHPERPQGFLSLSLSDHGDAQKLVFDPASQLDTLVDLINETGVSRLHIHHLFGQEDSARKLVDALGLPFDFTVHDYSAISPSSHLLDQNGNFKEIFECSTPAQQAQWTETELAKVSTWRAAFDWLITEAERVIVPSFDVELRLKRVFPDRQFTLAAHPESNLDAPVSVKRINAESNEPLEVLLLGEMLEHKGASVVLECAQIVADRKLPITFVVLGDFVRRRVDTKHLPIKISGRYAESQLPQLIEQAAAHLCWFPSRCPETYCYTLSAACAAGLPVLAPNIGAFSERVSGRDYSFIIDWNLSAEEVVDVLMRIRELNFVRGEASNLTEPASQRLDARFYDNDYVNAMSKSVNAKPKQVTKRDLALAAEPSPRVETSEEVSQKNLPPRRPHQTLALQLQEAQCGLGETIHELEQTRAELARLQEHVRLIESSFTWKLRNGLVSRLTRKP